MNVRHGLLYDRTVSTFLSIFCAISSVWSWYSLARGIQHRYDLYSIKTLFLAFALFIVTSIAYRSAFWADRVAFGALAVVCALVVARALSFTPAAIFAMNIASAFMWTIAAVVALLALLLGFRAPSQE